MHSSILVWRIPDEVAEWLRRWTANPLCSAHVGSNPILIKCSFFLGDFSGGLYGKASAYNVEDLGSIPGSGRSSREGNGNPLH